jgi:xanthine dehydrogenase YagR molybdenum-binding subunit
MVAAEVLGLDLVRVVVRGGDTGPNVYAPVSGGSMTTPAVMPAVRSAAGKVRRSLLSLAADVLEISADDLTVREGRIRSRDGALDVDVVEVTGKLGNATIDGSGARGPNPDGFRVNTFGCQIAQVAVDTGTGVVHVERIVAVHDVGRIVNPLGASSQLEGGVIQGVGYALMEDLVVDPTTGVPVNGHLDDYKLPTIADVPEIVWDFVNVADENLPNLGAKGLGEPPIVPTAAAIANAFAHATGRRAASLPLTPARVLETLA